MQTLEIGVVTLERASGTIVNVHDQLYAVKNSAPAHLPNVQTAWELFLTWRITGAFAAHNAATEDTALRALWPFCNINGQVCSWGPWIDTCQLYKNTFPKLTDYSLMALIQFMRLEPQLNAHAKTYCKPEHRQPHCALYDALAATLLLLAYEELKKEQTHD